MPAKFSNPFWRQERDALEVLARNKIQGAEIIRTSPDCVLFVQAGKAYTAWLEEGSQGILRLDDGFVAEF